ncbi:sec-independent protein translocase protein TATA, chloroplastic-like [Curcuma longa]|uniref:sec-independent protein translocase protein TATA, chloroplastic-like n=1 Tax=Curcuma longa TaxID=136217 RepID=UPI003D9F57FF
MMTAMAFGHPSCASLTAPARSPRLLASSSCLFFAGGPGRASLALRSRPLRRRQSWGGGALGCRCLFGLGVPELLVIAGVAALVFGPKKLPEIGRSIGKTVKSFQQAAKEFETELKKDPDDSSTMPPAESSKSVSGEDERKKLETSGSKDS